MYEGDRIDAIFSERRQLKWWRKGGGYRGVGSSGH